MQKLWKMGRLCCIFMWCFVLTGYARTSAQAQKVSLNLSGASLYEVFSSIRQQTGLRFLYNVEELGEVAPVTVKADGEPVAVVLERIFDGTALKFVVDNDVITVMRKEVIAQQPDNRTVRVTGVVRDASNAPLPGVTVVIKGTTMGTATDMDGHYSMTLPGNGKNIVLVYSFVGMEEKEIVYQGQTEINVVLEPDVKEMDEVIVTGYFNKSKDSFTGSVTQAKREELQKFGNVNLIQALSMVDPSFKIKENNTMGSDPNTLPDFFVRGESSFMGESNIPTFIVDGYEVSLQRVFDMDMERVESITVLKDASATILYGSRAANGVVVIETRRPAGGKFQVNYTNRTSLSIADLSDYDLMDARGKLEYEQKAGLYDNAYINYLKHLETIKANVERGVNTDWLAQPLRNPVSHAHSLYIDGGTDAVVYGLGLNYNRKNGVMKKSSREVFGVSFDLTYRVPEKINIRNSFEFTQTNVKNSPYGSFSLYAKANPYNPIYDDEGKLMEIYEPYPGERQENGEYQNPLYNATLPYKDESKIHTISNNLNVDYWFLPELRFKGSVALTRTLNSSDKFKSPDHTDYKYSNLEASEKGKYTRGSGSGFSYNINATLNYNLQENNHLLFAGVGLNLIQNKSKNDSYTATGFMDGRFHEVWFGSTYENGGKPSGSEEEDRMAGFFANVNYSYDNRYFADFSGRLDGSSKYGKDKRFAPLWSVGIGWNLNNEHFMENAEWLSRLTVRASIGETGNQNFNPYQARTTLEYQKNAYFDGMGAVFMSFGNPRLEWQKSLKRNIGLDLEVLQRRLTVRFDYYNDRTDGLLLPVSVTPSMGFTSYTENFGEQTNKGYEFDMNAVIIRKQNFDLAINFSGTHNENKISKISSALRALNKEGNELGPEPTKYTEEWNKWNEKRNSLTSPIAMYEEGESINAIKAVRSLGINPASGKELFRTKDGGVTETWNYLDKVVVGCTDPTLEGNIGVNIIWKNWALNVLMRYSFGGQVYNSTLSERVEGASPYTNADRRVLEERWQKPGDHTFYKDIADRGVSNATSRFVQDNNYLEMSNVSLTYRLPREWLKKLRLSSVRIGLNTNDLFYVSSVKRERGLDYPFAREYTFSLNVNF